MEATPIHLELLATVKAKRVTTKAATAQARRVHLLCLARRIMGLRHHTSHTAMVSTLPSTRHSIKHPAITNTRNLIRSQRSNTTPHTTRGYLRLGTRRQNGSANAMWRCSFRRPRNQASRMRMQGYPDQTARQQTTRIRPWSLKEISTHWSIIPGTPKFCFTKKEEVGHKCNHAYTH